ncbi:hypothetical protein [Leptospira noguchii]|uniref:hypothetical protein n=1 Tax=Leptospira noguchii TaxID=28182 RepID=UPI000B121B15|nr:hypothetical protein [Leptospira noguchii]
MTSAVAAISFGLIFWAGPVGLIPLLVLPYTQYKNHNIVEGIFTEYETQYCGL